MTTEEKFAALCALTETSLRMRKPGDWYVSANNRECKEGSILAGHYGNGSTPYEAIEDDWKQISAHDCVVINAGSKDRKHVQWNGFMWRDITPRKEQP